MRSSGGEQPQSRVEQSITEKSWRTRIKAACQPVFGFATAQRMFAARAERQCSKRSRRNTAQGVNISTAA
jgi:hypothetical protein